MANTCLNRLVSVGLPDIRTAQPITKISASFAVIVNSGGILLIAHSTVDSLNVETVLLKEFGQIY